MLLSRACVAVDVSGTLHWTPAVGSKTHGEGPLNERAGVQHCAITEGERTAGFSVVRGYRNEKGQAMCPALRSY
jgi:hypothetical protein